MIDLGLVASLSEPDFILIEEELRQLVELGSELAEVADIVSGRAERVSH